MEQPLSAFANATLYLPSPADLLLAFPRLLSKAGSFAEHIDSVFGRIRSGGSIIAEPTASNASNATAATTAGLFIQESVAAASAAARGTTGNQDDIGMFQALKSVGSFFSYVTSKWAIATFATAILLNRTHFYASSRVPLSFDKLYLRLALYTLPTLLFLYRIQSVLQAIRCQTAPSWSEMQYGEPGRLLDTDFAGEGGFLWRASSTLLFWEDLETSCKAVNMFPTDASSTRPAGSLALLWPLFLSLGFSQFIETLSCSLQGRQPLQEVGMTIFEHSLAFAEAEAVVTKPLVMDSARFWKPKSVFTPDGTSLSVSRTALSQFANVPPEVLLISLISSFSHLTSNILAIIGIRAKFRLITTGIWGFAYMTAFAWSFLRFASTASEPGPQVGILRFPTVCIVGFIPHLIILIGIMACGGIYLLAFAFTVLAPPPGQTGPLTWKDRIAAAYGNLHANIHLSAITPLTVNWHEDFYTAILKVGFTVLTAASEAVYLNEGTKINVNSMTWLEKKRLQELIARRRRFRQNMVTIPHELHGDAIAEGVEVDDSTNSDLLSQHAASGYARERKTREAAAKLDASRAMARDSGVGLQQRRGRWNLTLQFLKSILRLLMAIQARMTVATLRRLRIAYRPRWLRRLAGPPTNEKSLGPASGPVRSQFSMAAESLLVIDEQGTSFRPSVNFDIDDFARARLRKNGLYEEDIPNLSEERLNDYTYKLFLRGGRWGDVDTSGDYNPFEDDDSMSVTSEATTSVYGEWSDISDGQRTPTQTSSFPRSRESTPMPDIANDLSHLSHLLDPRTSEDREEARLLSRHLQSPGVMTRSHFRKLVERDEARVLTTSRLPMNIPEDIHVTPEEEERMLEEFLLNRRSNTANNASMTGASWDSGAEGMGSEGPQCVVCQLSPRTVLVWPCGCLSLCDECRVGLASKNYTTCVCCRTKVVAYSRLYVP